jgi:hypothetical protein
MSRRPGLRFKTLAGVVCKRSEPHLHNYSPSTDLGVLAALEERSDPDQADVVVPHHRIFLVLTGKLEGILEHCNATY